MAIDYPFDLRTILIGRQKTQSLKYDQTQPLSGPAYLRKLSTDAPAFYNVTFRFIDDDNALLFRAWVEHNNINIGAEFNLPMKVEGSESGANSTQIVQVIPDSDILSNVRSGPQGYEYSCTVRCRKETTGLEDYYELIQDGGKYLLDGRSELDEALNWYGIGTEWN